MKRPRLSKKAQRAWRKLLKPLLRRPYEAPLCQYPRPRDIVMTTVVVVDLRPHLSGNT